MDRAVIDAALALVCDPYETFTDEEAERLEDAFGLEGFSIERVLYPDVEREFSSPGLDEVSERDETLDALRDAMHHLTDRQADVVELRFGIRNGRDYTQAEVGAMLGISQQAVEQHEQAAMRKIRVLLAEVF